MMPFVLAGWLFVVGIYGMVTSRNLVHLVVCLGVVQSSTYVLLLEAGFRTGGTAPIFKDVPAGTRSVDPVVQALVLTDIVIGVTVAALLLALAVQVHKKRGSLDPNDIQPMAG
jgi:multicomponent Na+:H+ antiporter subunit C